LPNFFIVNFSMSMRNFRPPLFALRVQQPLQSESAQMSYTFASIVLPPLLRRSVFRRYFLPSFWCTAMMLCDFTQLSGCFPETNANCPAHVQPLNSRHSSLPGSGYDSKFVRFAFAACDVAGTARRNAAATGPTAPHTFAELISLPSTIERTHVYSARPLRRCGQLRRSSEPA
jgi:hypothetical protein